MKVLSGVPFFVKMITNTYKLILGLILTNIFFSCGNAINKKEYQSPDQRWGNLFFDVQRQAIFEHSKTFADAIPKLPEAEILKNYSEQKSNKRFNLKAFIQQNFVVEIPDSTDLSLAKNLNDYLNLFYKNNLRKSKDDGGSIIPTRKNYLAGGPGFNEMSYWNSYFAMLGLISNDSLLQDIVLNNVQFIQDFDFVPEGNRSYLLTRKSPPMLSLMIEQLADKKKDLSLYIRYLPQLTKEYQFWMSAKDEDEAKAQNEAKASGVFKNVVFLPNENILNRYFDTTRTARPEYYREDMALAINDKTVFQNIMISDFAKWNKLNRFKNVLAINTLPVDLNALLYHLEITLAKAYRLKKQVVYAKSFTDLAMKRKLIFDQYFWNENIGFYSDCNYKTKTVSNNLTLAGVLPLFVGLASENQAIKISYTLKKILLKPNGLVNSPEDNLSSAQWQYLAIQGLRKYKQNKLANEIKNNWIKCNKNYFLKHKAISESYTLIEQKGVWGRLDAAVGVLKALLNENALTE